MDKKIKNEISRLRREEGKKSRLAFAQLYVPHCLKFMPSAAHIEIYNILQNMSDDRGKKFAIAAPRNFGKSTLITHINALDGFCYGKEDYQMIISNTASQAQQIIDNIRKELMENELIRSDFPELFGPSGKLVRLREGDIVAHNGMKIVGLGMGQQVRGRRYGVSRPTLVIADDLENAESTFNAEARQKTKSWYENSVLNVGSEQTNYIYIGNLYHPYSLLGEYINPETSPSWMSKVYSAIISWPTSKLWEEWKDMRNYKAKFENVSGPEAAKKFYLAHKAEMDVGAALLWPERYSLYALMSMWADNELSFMSEYQNMPLDPRMLPFHMDEYSYWTDVFHTTEELLRHLGDNAEFFMAIDPSMAESLTKGDFSAIIVLARDKRDKTLYVIVADIGRYQPHETIKYIVGFQKRYKCLKIGVESNGFQGLLVKDLQKALKASSLYPELVPLKNVSVKTARILSIEPSLKSGALQLSRDHKVLLEQLRYFPKAKYDDGPDALEMAVRLCEQSQNNFMCWVAGSSRMTPEEIKKLTEVIPIEGPGPYGYMKGRRG